MVILQRWKKRNYEGPCVWYVYLNQALTNTVRTDGTEEDVKRLMENNGREYDTIYRGPDAEENVEASTFPDYSFGDEM